MRARRAGAGRLVDIAPHPIDSDRAYALIYPEHNADMPALQLFADWLERQARGESGAAPPGNTVPD